MTEESVRLIFGGDVMLGRLVADEIRARTPLYPMGRIASLMKSADLTIVNLECAITTSDKLWHGEPKPFYFGAPPQAVESLVDAGVDLVSLANNHSLDFDYKGLSDTLVHLQSHNIAYAGAGNNLDEARAPAIIEKNGIKFGMVAYCDHQEDFAATGSRPGIAYIDLENEKLSLKLLQQDLDRMKQAGVNWPILSLHWGPNMVERPSERFVRIGHAALDMGYRILFGHSAHVFHGIEIYKGCPIIYSAGDLVDDYYVDPYFRNDHALLFELELTVTDLKSIRLHPVFIEECRTQSANGMQAEYIARKMTEHCAEMGTMVKHGPEGTLEILP